MKFIKLFNFFSISVLAVGLTLGTTDTYASSYIPYQYPTMVQLNKNWRVILSTVGYKIPGASIPELDFDIKYLKNNEWIAISKPINSGWFYNFYGDIFMGPYSKGHRTIVLKLVSYQPNYWDTNLFSMAPNWVGIYQISPKTLKLIKQFGSTNIDTAQFNGSNWSAGALFMKNNRLIVGKLNNVTQIYWRNGHLITEPYPLSQAYKATYEFKIGNNLKITPNVRVIRAKVGQSISILPENSNDHFYLNMNIGNGSNFVELPTLMNKNMYKFLYPDMYEFLVSKTMNGQPFSKSPDLIKVFVSNN